jgi:NitT/TauT family transport system ATP-binding protein
MATASALLITVRSLTSGDPVTIAQTTDADADELIVKVDALAVAYGEEPAIARIDLDVIHGEFVSVLGPSGCGKSTMLNVLAGLLAPTTGSVTIAGQQISGPRGPAPDLGYVFQDHRLLPWRTVRRNIEITLDAKAVPRSEWDERIDRYLALLKIDRFAESWPLRLSGGQRQRASIARALAVEPAMILMDEPLSTLDEVTARSMRQELLEVWNRTGSTIVFVTHSIREAVFLSDRIIILSQGPATVLENFRVPLERPRRYEDPELAQVEAEIVARVIDRWGIHDQDAT